jgi:hypothetical protein
MPDKKHVSRAKRVEVSSGAMIQVQDQQYDCRVINIASTGVLLLAPKLIAPKTTLRLVLTLPKLKRPLEVDGIVMRTGSRKGQAIVGIKFDDPSEAFKANFTKFMEWFRQQQAAKSGKKPPAPAQPSEPRKPRRSDPSLANGPLTWAKDKKPKPGKPGKPERKKMTMDDLNLMLGVKDPLKGIKRDDEE